MLKIPADFALNLNGDVVIVWVLGSVKSVTSTLSTIIVGFKYCCCADPDKLTPVVLVVD